MKEWIKSHFWIAYLAVALIGSIGAYGMVTLKETPKEERPIIVNPAAPVVIRDTITVEKIKWRTPVKKVCCCESFVCRKNEQKTEISESLSEKSSSATSLQASPSQGKVEGE